MEAPDTVAEQLITHYSAGIAETAERPVLAIPECTDNPGKRNHYTQSTRDDAIGTDFDEQEHRTEERSRDPDADHHHVLSVFHLDLPTVAPDGIKPYVGSNWIPILMGMR
jgi:hypothetical protein